MTDIPVKRGTTGAEGEEKKLKGEWGMKDAEPLAGEASWTLPLSFTANHQTGSKAGMLQRESHSIWVGGDRGKWGGWQAAGDPEKQARGGEGAGTTSEAASALTSPGRHGPFPTP